MKFENRCVTVSCLFCIDVSDGSTVFFRVRRVKRQLKEGVKSTG